MIHLIILKVSIDTITIKIKSITKCIEKLYKKNFNIKCSTNIIVWLLTVFFLNTEFK